MPTPGENRNLVYAVLGAGRQGTAAAYDMTRFGSAERVVLGDFNLRLAKDAAERVNKLCSSDIAVGARIDVRHPAEIRRFLKGVDAFLSAVPYYYNLEIAKAGIRAGASMCDLGGNTDIVRKQLLLDSQAADAGISIVPDCGLDPGMSASLACYGMELLEAPREVYIWCGGLPQNPRPPFNYLLTFNFEGLANEYSGASIVLRDGEIAEVPVFEEFESLEIPPLGRLEAFVTSGGTSTCPWTFKGRLKVFQNKTLRYPGSYEHLRAMHELGLFSDKPIKINGIKVIPRRFLQALFEPKIRFPGKKDVVALRVKCVGIRNSQEAEVVLDVVDYYDDKTGFTAMERTTGWHASIVAIMMAHRHTSAGAKPLEMAVPGAAFVRELERRGINVKRKLSWTMS